MFVTFLTVERRPDIKNFKKKDLFCLVVSGGSAHGHVILHITVARAGGEDITSG